MIWFFVGRWSRGSGEPGCLGQVFAGLFLFAFVVVLWKWFLIVGLPTLALLAVAGAVNRRRGRHRHTPQAGWSDRR